VATNEIGDPPVDALVLDGGLRQSLVCVRSLGRAGLRVVVADRRRTPAGASRRCSSSLRLPDVTHDAAAFVDAVRSAVERLRPRIVIASHDGSIEALRAHRDSLGAPLALAAESALALAVSKEATYGVADHIGVRRPRGATVRGPEELAAALREIPLPVVVKPDRSWIVSSNGGVRMQAQVAVDATQAERSARRLLATGVGVLVQEWLPGRREAISLLRQGGDIKMRFAQVAYRMAPPLGGSSVLRESIDPPPDAVDAAERLVTAMDLDGYSEVEFRRAADGEAVLMEVNARLSASVEVAVRAGVDFPRGFFAWAAGEPVSEVAHYRAGVRMRWLGGDVHWLWRTLRTQGQPDSLRSSRAAAVFLGDFLRPAAYDYVSVSDPLPAAVATAQFLGDTVGSVTRHARKVIA
jgi:predicted ATP-grasp superfamily ATP-dependent carboligase